MPSAPYDHGMVPGSVLAGRFEVLGRLARGGMAEVLEARDEHGVRVAIKILDSILSTQDEALLRFRREAAMITMLTSPHVVRVIEAGETDGGRPFIVMDLLEGNDLRRELRRRRRIPIAEAATYLVQACDAMIEAHEAGIVHRDLKPSNLFLAKNGNERVLKILDFGISKLTKGGSDAITLTRDLFGSPSYMSPETFRSAKHADERSDIWSLGVIFYEMLTGEPPFVADTPVAVGLLVTTKGFTPASVEFGDVPSWVDTIIDRTLKKNPDARYQHVRDLLEAIRPFVPALPRRPTAREDLAGASDDDPRTIAERDVLTRIGYAAPALLRGQGGPAPPKPDWAEEEDAIEAPTRIANSDSDPHEAATRIARSGSELTVTPLIDTAPGSGVDPPPDPLVRRGRPQLFTSPLLENETGPIADAVSVTANPVIVKPRRRWRTTLLAAIPAFAAACVGLGFWLGHHPDGGHPGARETPNNAPTTVSAAPLARSTEQSPTAAASPAASNDVLKPPASASASKAASSSAAHPPGLAPPGLKRAPPRSPGSRSEYDPTLL
jgi:serine/threonine protein kinase